MRGTDSEKVKHAQELILSHVTITCDIIVLENWLQVNALDLDLRAVQLENVVNLRTVSSTRQVLPAGQKRVVLRDRGNTSCWSLVDTLDCECSINIFAEIRVAEEALRISRLVLLRQCFELIVREREIHGGEDRFELRTSDATLAQLIKVPEEFLDTDAFHHDDGPQAVLDFVRIVRNDDMVLHIAVVDHIKVLGLLLEESGDLLGAHTDLLELLRLGVLSLVSGVHVLGAVNILAEMVIVDLLDVATITVAAHNEIEHFFAWRHDVERFHDTQELLGCNVLLCRAIKVHEAGFEQDPV